MQNTQSKSKVWEIIGKIAVIVTIAASFVTIANYFYSKEEKISATGEFINFSYPQNLIDKIKSDETRLQQCEKDINSSDIQKLLPETLPDKYSVANQITTFINKNKESSTITANTEFSQYSLKSQKYFWIFTIKNEGSKEASTLNLELPFGGYYKVKRAGESDNFAKFDQNIKLGDLRPDNEITVEVWNEQNYSDYRNYRVTSVNGITKVDFPTKLTGFYTYYFYLSPFLIGIPIVILLIVILIKILDT